MTGPEKEEVLDDLPERFAVFRDEEVAASKEKPEHLVCPSGSLNADLLILLHYPTFKTREDLKLNGTTAADVNPCINFLIKKGFSTSSCLFLDRYCRRLDPLPIKRKVKNKKSHWLEVPMDRWSSDLSNIHRRFSLSVMQTSKAKVFLIFGDRNKQEYLDSPQHQFMEVQLDTSVDPVQVAIEYHESRVKRVLIFCPHPEWLLHRDSYIQKGLIVDQIQNLAAALSGITLDLTYANRLYRGMDGETGDNFRAKLDKEGSALAQVYTLALRDRAVKAGKASAQKRAELAKRDAQITLYEEAIMPGPDANLSVTAVKLLAVAEVACAHEDILGVPLSLDQLDARLLEWLKDWGIHTETQAYDWMELVSNDGCSLTEVIEQQLLVQYEEAVIDDNRRRRRAMHHSSDRQNNPLLNVIYEEAQSTKRQQDKVVVACKVCNLRRFDNQPIYMITDGAYVLKSMHCAQCGTTRSHVPVERTLPVFSHQSKQRLYADTEQADIQPGLRLVTKKKGDEGEEARKARKEADPNSVIIGRYLIPPEYVPADFSGQRGKPSLEDNKVAATPNMSSDVPDRSISDIASVKRAHEDRATSPRKQQRLLSLSSSQTDRLQSDNSSVEPSPVSVSSSELDTELVGGNTVASEVTSSLLDPSSSHVALQEDLSLGAFVDDDATSESGCGNGGSDISDSDGCVLETSGDEESDEDADEWHDSDSEATENQYYEDLSEADWDSDIDLYSD